MKGGGACDSTLSGCTISNNSASFEGGGGVSDSVLSNCSILNNSTPAVAGGAWGGTLNNCVISGNFAQDSGGGMYVGTANNCIFSNNSTLSFGGGADNTTLNNCLLINNTGDVGGGGAYSGTLINCTLSGNFSDDGSGANNATLQNCINYYNIGSDDSGNTLSYCCASDAEGTGCITNAPLFVDQSDGNFQLESNCPCINAGNNGYVKVTNDLAGNPRIVGGTVDMGAYEYQTPASVISYAWLEDYDLPTDGSVDYEDLDGTGFDVYQDWIAGLNPTNSASVLAMLPPANTNNANGVTVSWESVSGIKYFLQRSTNLQSQGSFSTIRNNITGQSGTTSYNDTTATGPGPYIYRVGVQ